MRGAGAIALLVALPLLGGCTLLNAPDRSLLDAGGGDAGDAGVDGDAGDGGVDGDAGPPPPPPERCDNGVDDDGDGLVDCEDPGCQGAESCCRSGVVDVRCSGEAGWCEDASGSFGEGWRQDGVWTGDGSLRLRADGSAAPAYFAYRGCFALASGGRFTFHLIGPPSGCDGCRTAFVLTAADDPQPGTGRFFEDLGVEYVRDDSGQWLIRLTQGGRPVRRGGEPVVWRLPEAVAVTVRVTIAPGADEAGRAALLATVELDPEGDGTGREPGVLGPAEWPFVRLADLLSECSGGGAGLRPVLEGQGGVQVESFSFARRECASPAVLRTPPDDPLCLPEPDGSAPASCVPLRFQGDRGGPDRWATADGEPPPPRFGLPVHPALAGYCDPTNGCRGGAGGPWLLAVSITDADPALGLFSRVGYAVETARQPSASWSASWDAVGGEAPALGGVNPTCLPGEGCSESDRSVGHPALLALPPTGEDAAGAVVASLEEPEVGAPPRIVLRRMAGGGNLGPAVDGAAQLTLCTDEDAGCPSEAEEGATVVRAAGCQRLEAPVLLPAVGRAPGTPYAEPEAWSGSGWLLYLCDPVVSGRPRIEARAWEVGSLGAWSWAEMRVVVPGGALQRALGAAAARVVDLAAVASFGSDGRFVVRLWVLAADPRTGQRRLYLWQGAGTEPTEGDVLDAWPAMQLYPVAPLLDLQGLRAASRDVDFFCSAGGCRIEGFDVGAVARKGTDEMPAEPDDVSGQRLRFLFAVRRELETRLFPLDQTWPGRPGRGGT